MAIQHRRGNESDFVAGKMLPGELAVTTDGSKKAWIAFGAGDVKEFAFQDDIPLKISEIENDEEFIKNTVTDLKNYYLKSETYTQEEINQLISVLPKYSVVVVDSLPLVGDLEKIYLLKAGDEEGNLFDEYIYVNSKWERIGSQRIDLSNYVTKQEAEKLSNDINSNSELIKTKANAIITEKSGSAIVATDSSEDAPEGLNVYGKSTQETTTGKNKFNSLIVADRTHNGIQTTRNEDGTIHISGTSTTGARYIKSDDNEFLRLPAGTYTITPTNFKIEITGGNGRTESGTFTISEETGFKNAYFSFDTTTNQNQTIGIQIEEGTVATPYEPYTGGIPSPNPEYPQPIESVGDDGSVEVKCTGKNLWNALLDDVHSSNSWGGNWYRDGQTYVCEAQSTNIQLFSESGNPIYSSHKNKVRPNDKITISTNGLDNTKCFVLYYDKNGEYIGFSSGTIPYTETIPQDVYFVGFRFNYKQAVVGQTYRFNVQIEYGTVATPYEPYKPKQTLAITTPNGLPGIKVTDASLATYTDENGQMWCADEVDFERGVYVQRFLKSKLTKENYIWSTIQYTGIKENHTNFRVEIEGTKKNGYVFSNILPMKNNIWGYDVLGCQLIEGNNIDFTMPYESLGITKDATENERISAMKTYLDSHEIYFYAELNTPIETPLTEEELSAYKKLTMNYPTTTILNDDNAYMKVEYIADTQNHIEQNYVPVAKYTALEARVSALEQNALS